MILLLWATLAGAHPLEGEVPACEGDPATEVSARVQAREGPESLVGIGLCLERLGLNHLAQRHHIEAIRFGRGRPGYGFALSSAFTLGERLGEVWSLMWALRGGEEALWSASPARDAMLWVHGTRLVEQERLGMAISVLSDVEPGSRWYPHAQLEVGRAEALRGRSAEALLAYRRAARSEGPAAAEGARRGARLLLEGARADEAVRLLKESPSIGALEPTVALAKVALDRNDPDAAQRVRAVRRAARKTWVPEAGLVDARLHQGRCATRVLKRWRQELAQVRLILQGMTAGEPAYGGHTWRAYFGPDRVDVGLDPQVLARIERDRRVEGLGEHLEAVVRERARLESLRDELGPETTAYLERLLGEGERALQALASVRFLAAVRSLDEELAGLEARAEELAGAEAERSTCRSPRRAPQ